MYKVEIGETSSRTDKLLFNIQELLMALVDKPTEEPQKSVKQPNIDEYSRVKLLELAKTFPKGSLGKYTTLSTAQLKEKIKEVQYESNNK